jgi:hypothetical protein
MADESLTFDEACVLELAGDEFGAFTFLVWLGESERQPDRASAAAEALLDRSLLAIEEHRRGDRHSSRRPRQVRFLAREDALRAIRDRSKWRDTDAEPFVGDEPYYEAHATDVGMALLRKRGWETS